VAELVHEAVGVALEKADVCLNNARKAHERAILLAKQHRK
jgi:hypothetical protein